jgi:cytochrome P450
MTTTNPPESPLPAPVQSLLAAACPHRVHTSLSARYGDVFSLRTGSRRTVVLSNPAHIRQVFAASRSAVHGGRPNAVFAPLMGERSLLLTEDEDHLRARRLVFGSLDGSQESIVDAVRTGFGSWPTDRAMPAWGRVDLLSMDVALRVVLGPGDWTAWRASVRRLALVTPLVLLGWSHPALRRVGPWRRYLATRDHFDGLLYAEITRRRQEPTSDGGVLSRLIAEEPDDATVRDHATTLLTAGYAASSAALSHVLVELARHPAAAREARHAADLTAVVKEVLRLNPVIPYVTRQLAEPMDIGGYHLPVGTVVAPSIVAVQHDATHHPDPKAFRPSRFRDGTPGANTWIPFGGGVRRCVGAEFAMTLSVAFLRELLARYDVARLPGRSRRTRRHGIAHISASVDRVRLTPRAA